MAAAPARQPYLHDLVGLVAAPTQCWSGGDGDISPTQIGLVHADVRVVRTATLTVDGDAPVLLRSVSEGATSRMVSLVRGRQDESADGPDPTLRVDRVRELVAGRLTETITVSSVQDRPLRLALAVRLGVDAAPIDRVKAGRDEPEPVRASIDAGAARWCGGGVSIALTAPGAVLDHDHDGAAVLITRMIELAPRGRDELIITLDLTDTDGPVVAGTGRLPLAEILDQQGRSGADPAVDHGVDPRLRPWLTRSVLDLDGLRMRRPGGSAEFLAAGAPWYLTLFGRDSLWAARLLLPVDRELAHGTLQVLAELQGAETDAATDEAPGKIIHELRRAAIAFLPPRYYGTIDATCLWILLLHDTWRAGLADQAVRPLLPNLRAALGWITDSGDPDGDGFLEYHDATGRGLANQGWKDSADSIRFHDGTIADGPVALCEAQAYAHAALRAGADLLAAFDAGDPEPWRRAADRLATAFRERFWVERTGLPALALDGRKRQVDAVTSNLGHLLGTGLLDPAEERVVADRLVADDLSSGLGLRTMSTTDRGYNPLSYHCGSVWPHDTAIAIRGLLAGGFTRQAAILADGLADAAVAFDHRLPELWSGEGPLAVPYPAACRPQAWSAAAVVPAVAALRPR